MTRNTTPHRIHGQAELIGAIPYLLGFHPHASLVLVGLDDGRLVVTARLDLQCTAPQDTRRLGELDSLLEQSMTAMARGGASQVIALAYPDPDTDIDIDIDIDTESDTAGPLAADTERSFTRPVPDLLMLTACSSRAGIELSDYLQVSQGSWHSLACPSTACCPESGTAVSETPSLFQTQATVAGLAPVATRARLHDRFAPTGDLVDVTERITALEDTHDLDGAAGGRCADQSVQARDVAAVQSLITAARTWQDRGGPCVATEPASSAVTDADVAEFGVALGRTVVRDAVWMAVDDGRLPNPGLWLELARRLPAPHNTAPLFLYGWHAWRNGDGAVSRIAADRALTSHPDYTAARLLLTALDAGINPESMPTLTTPA